MDTTTQNDAVVIYSGEGYLIISAVSANEALPIEGARVHIKGNDEQNKDYIFITTTDESGLTEIIALKAPSKELSLSPNNKNTFASINMSVSKDGYYTREFLHVPVFDGVTSLQRINLIARTPFDSDSFDPNTATQESAAFE